jgi:hypothetical protein
MGGVGGTVQGLSCGGLFTGQTLSCNATCVSHACAPFIGLESFGSNLQSGRLVCQPAPGCRQTGELCMADVDCCGNASAAFGAQTMVTCVGAVPASGTPGTCSNAVSCKPPGGECKGGGLSCNAQANCCAGVVNTHPLVCQQDNMGVPRCLVTTTLDCTMTTGAMLVGTQCATSADCCGYPCIPSAGNYTCAASACIAAGGVCTSWSDCCPGLPCSMDPGSATGICGGVPETDGGIVSIGKNIAPAGGCQSLYGQQCTVATDCCAANGSAIPCTKGRCIVP